MVTIIIVPVGSIRGKPSGIFFLGSILDEAEFASKGRISGDTFPIQQRKPDNFFLKNETAKERKDAHVKSSNFSEDKPTALPLDKIVRVEKITYESQRKWFDAKPVIDDAATPAVLQERAVLFSPPIPERGTLSQAAQKDMAGFSGRVKLKAAITPDGTVKNAEILQTCGYPELDLAAIRHVKKWRFQPLSPDKPQREQEQIIIFEFK